MPHHWDPSWWECTDCGVLSSSNAWAPTVCPGVAPATAPHTLFVNAHWLVQDQVTFGYTCGSCSGTFSYRSVGLGTIPQCLGGVFAHWDPDAGAPLVAPKCECGAASCGTAIHSSWCPCA